jgi:hypothetical protein
MVRDSARGLLRPPYLRVGRDGGNEKPVPVDESDGTHQCQDNSAVSTSRDGRSGQTGLAQELDTMAVSCSGRRAMTRRITSRGLQRYGWNRSADKVGILLFRDSAERFSSHWKQQGHYLISTGRRGLMCWRSQSRIWAKPNFCRLIEPSMNEYPSKASTST